MDPRSSAFLRAYSLQESRHGDGSPMLFCIPSVVQRAPCVIDGVVDDAYGFDIECQRIATEHEIVNQGLE